MQSDRRSTIPRYCVVWSSAACFHARTLVPSKSEVFPDHWCRGQVCLISISIQKSPRINKSLLILRCPSSYFTFCANAMASASAEVADRSRSTAAHTGVPAQTSPSPSKSIKRQAGDQPWFPCDTQTRSPVAYSTTSGAAFLSTARAQVVGCNLHV